MWTLYSLHSSLSPFLRTLLLILMHTFGPLIYLANEKEESQVSLIEKHIVVIISVIQSRKKNQADFCVKPCWFDDVFLFKSLKSRCSFICPLYALEHALC